jgi:hypothetical protein
MGAAEPARQEHLTTDDAQIIEARFAVVLAALDNADPPRRRRVVAKTIRLRDKEHRRFVAALPCLVCGRTPADPHHLRYAQPRALGSKVSDEFTVPVCRLHHSELHRVGDEAQWWLEAGVDPLPVALKLWRQSHGGDQSEPDREPAPERIVARLTDPANEGLSGEEALGDLRGAPKESERQTLGDSERSDV